MRILDNHSGVIGFDLGSWKAGFAILDSEGKLVKTGFFKARTKSAPDRRREFSQWLDTKVFWEEMLLLGDAIPNLRVAVEMPWVEDYRASASKVLYRLLGILDKTVMGLGYNDPEDGFPAVDTELIEVSTSEVKEALTGKGNATKPEMVQAAKVQFGVILSHDVADALGVALAGRRKIRQDAIAGLAQETA